MVTNLKFIHKSHTFVFYLFAWRGLDKACQMVKGRDSAQRKVIASLKPKMLSILVQRVAATYISNVCELPFEIMKCYN